MLIAVTYAVILHLLFFFMMILYISRPNAAAVTAAPLPINARLIFNQPAPAAPELPLPKPPSKNIPPSKPSKPMPKNKPDETPAQAQPHLETAEPSQESPAQNAEGDNVTPTSNTATNTPVTEIQTVAVAKLTQLPRLREALMRQYPERMRQLGKEAVVNLELLIDENGLLRKIQVIKSAGPEFDQAALHAVSQARFFPAEIHAKPVAVYWIFPVHFTLK